MTVDEIASSEDEVLAEKVDKSTRSVKISKRLAGLAVGFIGGMFFTVCLSYSFPPEVNNVKVFQRENKPSVMRMYRLGADGLYVENKYSSREHPSNYIKLNKHLDGIKYKPDRDIKEIEIKKAVGWYD